MRSKIISAALLALGVVLSACKKDKDSTDPIINPTSAALTAKVDGVNFQSKDAGAVSDIDSQGSKRMSGTFSFTAPATGSDATGTKTVTNGSFTDVPFIIQ